MSAVRFRVNGRQVEVTSDPATPLVYVLRNELGLKGTKLGCAKEQCGACAVLVDGRAVLSCNAPVGQFQDRAIETAETENSAVVNQVRRAFVEAGAAQCGYCIPGMVIAVAALMQAKPRGDADIRAALQPHLCRCGTHMRVLEAARALIKAERRT